MVQPQWFSGFPEAFQTLAAFVPALVGAAVLLLSGWVAGRLLAWLASRLVSTLPAHLSKRA